MEVSNLFFNTPVRRKFTRTTQTECSHCTEAFTRIALAFRRFISLCDTMKRYCTIAPYHELARTDATFFGDDLASGLIAVTGRDEGIQLSGFVVRSYQFSRANNRCQYFFLNGRHIRDRALQHALGEAYRGCSGGGVYPLHF